MHMSTDITADTGLACRLCGGETQERFKKPVLLKYDIGYHECSACGSMQSDEPHWLDETYADPRPMLDISMVSRTQRMAASMRFFASLLKAKAGSRGLDWGGGNGLFCRMMRDRGIDYYCHEPYVTPYYNVGFDDEDPKPGVYTFVTAFEVFEHLPTPRQELEKMLATDADLLFFSTQLYTGQNEDWTYLANRRGAHVFFYSHRALSEFAAERGYDFFNGTGRHMWIKKAPKNLQRSSFRDKILKKMLNGTGMTRLVVGGLDLLAERGMHHRQRRDYEHVFKELFSE